MTSFTFPKKRHLRRPAEFKRIFDGGSRIGDGWLLVFASPNELGWSRIGLSVSRKQGHAVRRQRIKRLLRESYRLAQHEIPEGYDFILIPRVGTNPTQAEYQQSLVRLAARLVRRLNTPRPESPASSAAEPPE